MSEPQKPSISDDINALIRSKTTTEKVDRFVERSSGKWSKVVEKHTVTHPPLLEQVHTTITSSPLSNQDLYNGSAGSKPPSRLDAIALLGRIERESRAVADVIRSRRSGSLTDRLSAISGAAVSQPDDIKKDIAKKARSWVITARIVTGWDAPPYTPPVPCPNPDCERRSTIRIHLAEQQATCIECGVYWDDTTVTNLADYVRWATEHLKGPKHWLTDPDGFPTECLDCLPVRREMAARVVERERARKELEKAS